MRNTLTEKEAREKVCPIMRASINPPNDNCLAAGCMMWRWDQPVRRGDSDVDKPAGYCGLAGVPLFGPGGGEP